VEEQVPEKGPELGSPEPNTPVRPVVHLTGSWAISVARAFLVVVERERAAGLDPVIIDECWVGTDLAIYIRYTSSFNPEAHAGQRIPNSNIDPTSGGYAEDRDKQGLWFLHDLQGPANSVFVDSLGYDWASYDPQPESWQYSVEQLPRLATVKERSG
jgi:hypothetical protein